MTNTTLVSHMGWCINREPTKSQHLKTIKNAHISSFLMTLFYKNVQALVQILPYGTLMSNLRVKDDCSLVQIQDVCGVQAYIKIILSACNNSSYLITNFFDNNLLEFEYSVTKHNELLVLHSHDETILYVEINWL